MKKYKILLFLLLCSSGIISAQEKFSIQQSLSFPEILMGSFMSGVSGDQEEYLYLPFNFELQYALSNKYALTMKPYFTFHRRKSETSSYRDTISFYHYGFNPGFRIYPNDTRLRGKYFGVNLIFGLLHINGNRFYEDEKFNENYFKLGLEGEFGCQWIIKGGFTFAAGLSVGKSFHVFYKGDSKENMPYTWFHYVANGMLYLASLITSNSRNFVERDMPLNEINSKISIGYSF